MTARARGARHWMRWCWLALAASLLATGALAGQVTVRAFLDRTQVTLGDTVTLNVEIDGATQVPAPDVSALRSDFDILGTSHNTSISIVNGQRSVKSLWAIGLRPLHEGTITIPALDVDGQSTAPLTLTVGAASATPRGGPGEPVFIRVTPSTRTPYVGEQVDLAIKLFYAPNVRTGSLNVPHDNDITVRELGNGTRYQAERGGRIYQVLEKHYAVTAQHPGPLNLPPVTFQGGMTISGGFSVYFGNGRTVTAHSAPTQLAVRAKPAAAGNGLWLPARSVTLQLSGLPAGGQVKAGQPFTLTLTEKAAGLPFESLPEPRLPTLSGVDVYPDKSQDHTGDDGHWLEGSRIRKFAIVPQHAGQLSIPAITLAWWNVETNQREVARIPVHTLQVVAAAGAPGQSPVPPPAAAASVPATSPAPVVAARPKSPAPAAGVAAAPASEHGLAWAALGLWLATVLVACGWWWRRHRRAGGVAVPPKAPDTPRRSRQAWREALRSGDVAARCETLLAWARERRPSVHSLGELAALLDSPAQCEAIADLQRARYAGASTALDADTLVAAFRHGFMWRKQTPSPVSDTALPPLYP